ncbi:MAG: TRAP transporter substrate-binding protein [Anaerolineae bacterium]
MRSRTAVIASLLLGSVLLALAVWLPVVTAQDQGVSLRIQAFAPPTFTFFDNLTFLARRVEQMSGGRVKIEPLPSAAVVPFTQELDGASRGVIDGALTTPGIYLGKHPAAVPLSHGPLFGMDHIDFFGWLYEGGGLELLNEWYTDVLKANVVAIPALPVGPQAQGWVRAPVKNWEEFKRYKLRFFGLGREVLSRAGMTVVSVPGGAVRSAAERGAIDGAEFIGGADDLRLGFHALWKFHLTPGMHEQVHVGNLLINRDVWNKLPADLQAIIRAAATEAFWRWWVRWQRQNADAYKEMVEEHGVKVMRTPDDIHLTFLKYWDEIWQEHAARDPFYRKVIDSQREYAKKVVPYRRSTWPRYEFLADYYWKDEIYAE